MSDEVEYEIVYTLRRRKPGQKDFEEIGFGISGQWSSPEQCAHMVVSDIQNYGWETEGDMPDPQTIKAEVEATSCPLSTTSRRQSTQQQRRGGDATTPNMALGKTL